MNKREKIAAKYIQQVMGADVHRDGWPDFLCTNPDGSIFAIEVKSFDDRLRRNQAKTHAMLRKAGIPVSIIYVDADGSMTEPLRDTDDADLAKRLGDMYEMSMEAASH